MIKVEGPNGVNIEFPDGTDSATIDRVMSEATGVKANPSDKSNKLLDYAGEAVGALGKIGTGIKNAVAGKQDPNFADVGGISEAPWRGGTTSRGALATMNAGTFAHSDAAYGDVIQKRLEDLDSFVSREKDANGYEIITYKDVDGSTKRGYVNEPGLDTRDFERVADGALPFVLGGGLAGGLLKAVGSTGLVAGAATHALGQGAASVASDVIAQEQGSEQGVDLMKAGLATGLGGFSQAVPRSAYPYVLPAVGGAIGGTQGDTITEQVVNGVVGAGGGFLAGKAFKGATTKRDKVIAPDEELPIAAQAEAKRAGIDLEDLTPEQKQVFSNQISVGQDPKQIASKIQTDAFGIPTTLGQRTKSPAELLTEKDVRNRGFGEESEKMLRAFDKGQEKAIQGAAFRQATPDDGLLNVGSKIAPHRDRAFGPADVRASDLGDSIRTNIQQAHRTGDKIISEAYDGVKTITPSEVALGLLPTKINRVILDPDNGIDDVLMTASAGMKKDLEGYLQGTLNSGKGIDGVDGGLVQSMGVMRQRLAFKARGAVEPNDRRVAPKILNAFDDWMEDVAEKRLVNGDPTGAMKMKIARGITRDVKQRFQQSKHGKVTPGGKLLQKIIKDDDSFEDVVGILIGSSGPSNAPKAANLQALQELKRGLMAPVKGVSKDSKRGDMLLRPSKAKETWDDIRLAHWSSLIVDKKGNMFNPERIKNNIDSAFSKQGKMLDVLYAKDEQTIIRKFRNAVAEAAYVDPNPSGSASGLLAQAKRGDVVSRIAKRSAAAQGQREKFVKGNILKGNFYMMLNKLMPLNIAGSRDSIGRGAVKRATGQNIKKVRGNKSFVGGISGNELGNE